MSALSPDGRSRWDGSSWVPLPQPQYVPPPTSLPLPAATPPKPARKSTSWTRPLQSTVAAWWVVQTVWYLGLPVWLTGPMNEYISRVATQMARQSPGVYQASSLETTLWVVVTISFVLGAVFAVAIAATVAVGARRRWTWLHYGVLTLLGFQVLGLPSQVAFALGLTGSTFVPSPLFYWVAAGSGLISCGLFGWLLVALLTRGPWAMTR